MTLQTTTFKGARYLVKFHDPIEWADTESYEAIEAVQHEAFTYISKQPVPTGVQIDNTDFWLLWADPNAQMEELRQLVAGYVDDVETLSGTVSGLSDDLQQEIENRETAIATINEDNWVTTNRIEDAAVTESKLSLQLQSKLNLYVTPEEYGAVGDGTTDDTQAFQTMLDSILGGTVVVLPQTKEYLVRDVLNVTKNQIGFISFAEMEYQPKIKFENTTVGFNVTGFGFTMHNIQLWGESSNTSTTLLKFDRDSVAYNGNIDAYISNCAFQNSNSLINISGRNVKIINNLFSQCLNLGITIEQTQNITTAMRGFVITGNRFHDVRIAISNNITAYVDEGCCIKVSDNYFDGCNVMYVGASDNVVITDNFFSRATVEATNIININKTIDEKTTCTIANNTINGVQSYTGNFPRTAISLIDVKGIFLITGNYASTKAQNAHIIIINTQNNIFINMANNIFLNYTRTSTITPTSENNISGLVVNNIFNGNVTGYSNCTVANNINANLTE